MSQRARTRLSPSIVATVQMETFPRVKTNLGANEKISNLFNFQDTQAIIHSKSTTYPGDQQVELSAKCL
jgi:hypothetical protein